MQQKTIVVGKRVTVGVGIGGLVAFGSHVWNMTHPDNQVDAAAVAGLQSFVVMAVQIFVANKFGITTHDDSGKA